MKPTDKLSILKSSNALDRIEYCRSLLGIHGFITESEEEKIRARILKWCDKNKVPVKSVSLLAKVKL